MAEIYFLSVNNCDLTWFTEENFNEKVNKNTHEYFKKKIQDSFDTWKFVLIRKCYSKLGQKSNRYSVFKFRWFQYF